MRPPYRSMPQHWLAIWRQAAAQRALLVALSLASGGCQSLGPKLKEVFAWEPNGAPAKVEQSYPGTVSQRVAALRCITEASRSAAEAGYAAATAASARGEPVDYASITSAATAAFTAVIEDSSPPSIPADADRSSAIAAAIADGITRAALAARRPSVTEITDIEAAKSAYSSDAVTAALTAGITAAAGTFGYATGADAIASSALGIVATRAAKAAAAAQQAAADAAIVAKLVAAVSANPTQARSIVSTSMRGSPALVIAAVSEAVKAAPQAAGDIVAGAVEAAPGQQEQIVAAAYSAAPHLKLADLRFMANQARSSSTGGNAVTSPNVAAPMSSGGGSTGYLNLDIDFLKEKCTPVEVVYATDRKPVPNLDFTAWKALLLEKGSDKAVYYGPDPELTKLLHYGICTVSIPLSHVAASYERPGVLETEKGEKHIMIRNILELDKEGMLREVTRMTAPDENHKEGKDAFIFIHGFNVSFNEAAMRAAQMSYDFKFLGAPILFSWSASGGIIHDTESVVKAEDGLWKLIREVKKGSKIRKLHLVAHSMGNRALVQVLKGLVRNDEGKIFGEIVLAAAEVSQAVFTPEHAKDFCSLADRVSIYFAANDLALKFSSSGGGGARIGQGGLDRFVTDGLQVINATGADESMFSLSHTYIANVRKVLDDLAAVLVTGAQPNAAPRSLVQSKDGNYWEFKK
jgi:esterase/lipase superfamily enzyme